MALVERELWSKGVKTKWTPPKNLFSEGTADEIASKLESASDNLRQAMSRLNFYVNRAGGNLPESRLKVLERAKVILRKSMAEGFDLDHIADWLARAAAARGKGIDSALSEAYEQAVTAGDALAAVTAAWGIAQALGEAAGFVRHLAEQSGSVWDLVLSEEGDDAQSELDEVGATAWLERRTDDLDDEPTDQSADPTEDYPGAEVDEVDLDGENFLVVKTEDAILVFREAPVGESVACCENCHSAWIGDGDATCPECQGPLEIMEGSEAERFADAYAYMTIAHQAQEAGEQLTEAQIRRRSMTVRRRAQKAEYRRSAGRYKVPLAIRRKIAKGAKKAARSGSGRLRMKRLAAFNKRLAASVEIPRSHMATFLAEATKKGIDPDRVRFEVDGDTVFVFSDADLSAIAGA